MKKINDGIRSYFILSKRLLHKKSFVAILVLVLLIVGALAFAANNGDSGIITVAVAAENSNDEIADGLMNTLLNEKGLVRFLHCDSPDSAGEAVERGQADAAWIFHDELDEKIRKYVNNTNARNAFVTVIQREESVFLRLSHEKLNALLYPYVSRALFLERAEDTFNGSLDNAIDYYYAVNADGSDLFEFVYVSDGGADEVAESDDTSFLVSPLRGLLAVMVVLSGFAVAMFYMQDESHGVFDRFPKSTNFSFSAVYHATAVFMVGAAAFIALQIAGISVGIGYELLVSIVYCLSAVAFCMCLRLILRDIRLFASLVVVLTVVTVVLCPILFSAPDIPLVQYLLPTYYYLKAVASVKYLIYMIAYSLVWFVFAFLLHTVCGKQRR